MPISLTPILLKTMERIVDRHIGYVHCTYIHTLCKLVNGALGVYMMDIQWIFL